MSGRLVDISGPGPALDHADLLLRELGAETRRRRLGPGFVASDTVAFEVAARAAGLDWERSGAARLTSRPGGPQVPPVGAPASAVRGALLALDLLTRLRTGRVARWPDEGLLAERAAAAGLGANGPLSVGGATRLLPTADGWLAVSLARRRDELSVPAAVGRPEPGPPWVALEAWCRNIPSLAAADRLQLLGIPAGPVPPEPPAATPFSLRRLGHRTVRSRPLVVDLSALWAGPLCAHLLGLAGARVIKVETPDRPDGARSGPARFYDALHADQESVVLRLDDPALRELLAEADVVVEASRPRALEQAGVDASEVVAAGTVWTSITAYGRTGPRAHWVGFGDDVAASAGLLAWESPSRPLFSGDAIADPLSGVHAALAASAALLAGGGHLVDVSMHGVAATAARLVPGTDGEGVGTT